MATHDYDIANQSGAAFRADLNNALDAIQSNNSNSSSPATTVSYQWWADTSAGVMKIRNGANDGWIELFQLDGTITLEDGSASTPGLAFRDDLNTGIFSSAADTLNIATGGVERVELGTTTIFNEDGADVDFRIEGDTEANLFYIDAGNDRIGITNSTPSTLLHIANSSDPIIRITKTGSSDAEIKNTNSLDLCCSSGGSAGQIIRFMIGSATNNLSEVSRFTPTEYLHQHTGSAVSVAEATSGNGGISLSSAGNGIHLGLNSATHGCIFNRISGSGSIFSFRFAGADKGNIEITSSAVAFNTGSDYRLKENAVAISDGITRLKTLKPYRFNFINEPSKTVDGFFAHEVTAVPEAVTGTKDQVATEDSSGISKGDPIYQSIDQSKLVPLIVAAVQELITKVETLESA